MVAGPGTEQRQELCEIWASTKQLFGSFCMYRLTVNVCPWPDIELLRRHDRSDALLDERDQVHTHDLGARARLTEEIMPKVDAA